MQLFWSMTVRINFTFGFSSIFFCIVCHFSVVSFCHFPFGCNCQLNKCLQMLNLKRFKIAEFGNLWTQARPFIVYNGNWNIFYSTFWLEMMRSGNSPNQHEKEKRKKNRYQLNTTRNAKTNQSAFRHRYIQ